MLPISEREFIGKAYSIFIHRRTLDYEQINRLFAICNTLLKEFDQAVMLGEKYHDNLVKLERQLTSLRKRRLKKENSDELHNHGYRNNEGGELRVGDVSLHRTSSGEDEASNNEGKVSGTDGGRGNDG